MSRKVLAPEQLTQALDLLRRGEVASIERMLPAVYEELRRIAGAQMAKERVGHTLQPTALVHEAYLRLVRDAGPQWESRAHFFGVAARVMRQVLVDHARRRGAQKRGSTADRVTLNGELVGDLPATDFDLLELHGVLDLLEETDPELAHLVELRFFGGLTLDETADVLQRSRRKVANDWAFARAWLLRRLSAP